MRITNTMMNNSLLNNIYNNQNRMEKLQQQLASGKKISEPSDDPVIASRSLKLRTDISGIEQFKKNNADGLSWVEASEGSLNNVTEILQRTRQLMVQGANGSNAPDDLKQVAEELKQLRTQMIHTGNATYAGRYLFSGYKSDQKLMVDDESSADFGKYNVSVETLTEKIEYDVGVGDTININVCGGDIFGNGANTVSSQSGRTQGVDAVIFPITINATVNDVFDLSVDGSAVSVTLAPGIYENMDALATEIETKVNTATAIAEDIKVVALGDRLQFISGSKGPTSQIIINTVTTPPGVLTQFGLTDSTSSVGTAGEYGGLIEDMNGILDKLNTADITGLSQDLAKIDSRINNVLRVRADLGARYNRLELTSNRLADDSITFTKLMSENEDADMAEVIMKLQSEENVYKAALSAGAKIIQVTLMDFLR